MLAVKGQTIVVGVSELRASADAGARLATYSLGSCIGVAAYDPAARVGGLLHFQLPDSSLDPDTARVCPAMFADTGMVRLLAAVTALGAEPRRLQVKLGGAARMLTHGARFDIGRWNQVAVRKALEQHGLHIQAQHLGGTAPRSMWLRLSDGAVLLKTGGVVSMLE